MEHFYQLFNVYIWIGKKAKQGTDKIQVQLTSFPLPQNLEIRLGFELTEQLIKKIFSRLICHYVNETGALLSRCY